MDYSQQQRWNNILSLLRDKEYCHIKISFQSKTDGWANIYYLHHNAHISQNQSAKEVHEILLTMKKQL